jgi:hypothetical protein
MTLARKVHQVGLWFIKEFWVMTKSLGHLVAHQTWCPLTILWPIWCLS